MKIRKKAIIFGLIAAVFALSLGSVTVFADVSASRTPAVELTYSNGTFSATNGFTASVTGSGVTPSNAMENAFRLDKTSYVTVTAPADKSFTTEGQGLTLVYRHKSSTNVNQVEDGGTESMDQLFSVEASDGRAAYICMSGLYYRSAKGTVTATQAGSNKFNLLTTLEKDVAISIPADGSGVKFFVSGMGADGEALYNFTKDVSVNVAKLFIEVAQTKGSSISIHKGDAKKTDYMTDTIILSDVAFYGKQFEKDDACDLFIERAGKRTFKEKFDLVYANGELSVNKEDYGVEVVGTGLVADSENTKAFRFNDTTTHLVVSAQNGKKLSESGAMTLVMTERVTSASTAGAFEHLLSVVDDEGQSANVCLGRLYLKIDGANAYTDTENLNAMKSETEQLVIVSIDPAGTISVYVNGYLVHHYFISSETKSANAVFATQLFGSRLSMENGSFIIRNPNIGNDSYNKNVLCLSDVKFFDRAMSPDDVFYYYRTTTAPVGVEALDESDYTSLIYGGVRKVSDNFIHGAFAFTDQTGYVAVSADGEASLTENGEGISFHFKQRSTTDVNVDDENEAAATLNATNADEAFVSTEKNTENGLIGAYICAGSVAYRGADGLKRVVAKSPTALLTTDWKTVSVVVNKIVRTIDVYVDGKKIQTYDDESGVVSDIVDLFSQTAERSGGTIYIRKSAETTDNTATMALGGFTIAEGGLTSDQVASYVDDLAGIISVKVVCDKTEDTVELFGESGTPIPAPSKTIEGYEFAGYYLDEEFVTPLEENATFSLTLPVIYARYSPVEYTVTYHLNGGEQNDENPATYNVETGAVFLAAQKQGYDFIGWYKTEDFVNHVTKFIPGTRGDVELYAKYSLKKYKITYALDGGLMTEDSVPTSYTVESQGFTLADAWKPHYDFIGWFTDEQKTTPFTSFDTSIAKDVTIYAAFSPVVYSIDYELNGGFFEGRTHITYTVEDAITLPAATKDGYDFDGWYTDEQLTQKLEKFNMNLAGNYTLFAKFTLSEAQVTSDKSSDEQQGVEKKGCGGDLGEGGYGAVALIFATLALVLAVFTKKRSIRK